MMCVSPLHHWRMTDGAFPGSAFGPIAGIVSGFDRLLLRSIRFVDGLDRFLASQRIPYKEFAGLQGD